MKADKKLIRLLGYGPRPNASDELCTPRKTTR
jgi:hypothetical protein